MLLIVLRLENIVVLHCLEKERVMFDSEDSGRPAQPPYPTHPYQTFKNDQYPMVNTPRRQLKSVRTAPG